MSSNTDLSSNTVSVPQTPDTIEPTSPFSFVKDNIDYTKYAVDFFEDEVSYFDIIKSFTNEADVTLFHCFNGVVCSAANYNDDGTVSEFLRDEAVTKKYTSINNWMNDYINKVAPHDYILDHVFIGENLVPLWKILIVSKEEEDEYNQGSYKYDWSSSYSSIYLILNAGSYHYCYCDICQLRWRRCW